MNDTLALLLIAHAAVTCFMTGLIWLVQLVHYPLMLRVSPDRFTEYEAAHMHRISWIVGPAMLAELVTGAWLVLLPLEPGAKAASWLGVALLIVIWVSTATGQGPMHGRLARGYDPQLIRQLVRTNWVRTAAWSMRAVIAGYLLFAAMG